MPYLKFLTLFLLFYVRYLTTIDTISITGFLSNYAHNVQHRIFQFPVKICSLIIILES